MVIDDFDLPTVCLFFIILLLNDRGWIRHFGWSPGFEYQQDADETSSGDGNKSSTSVKEKLAVLLQVARKVQNQLGAVCDAVEKIKKSVYICLSFQLTNLEVNQFANLCECVIDFRYSLCVPVRTEQP